MTLPTPLEELLARLTWRNDEDRQTLIAEMRALATSLNRDADCLEANPMWLPSEFGVVQQRGRDIDRECALLHERRQQLTQVQGIAKACATEGAS